MCVCVCVCVYMCVCVCIDMHVGCVSRNSCMKTFLIFMILLPHGANCFN